MRGSKAKMLRKITRKMALPLATHYQRQHRNPATLVYPLGTAQRLYKEMKRDHKRFKTAKARTV